MKKKNHLKLQPQILVFNGLLGTTYFVKSYFGIWKYSVYLNSYCSFVSKFPLILRT